MKKWTILAIAVLLVVSFASCGYQEGIREPDRQSFIWFSGQTQNAVAIVDNGEPVQLGATYYVDSETGERVNKGGKILYQVTPGKHEIFVKKEDRIVVHRKVLIGSGSTKEIWVP